MNFDNFFQKATGHTPFPYQRSFAEAPFLPHLVGVPTGLGKTAMAVVGWLWRRFSGNEKLKAATPRRLVYCLPMRVLVEQTTESAREWIGKLKAAKLLEGDGPSVHVLMGGESEDDWDIHPEREAILLGTQDMLLSRALNRGYAASRARWPMQFGLLHTDCLWVFDEIQLMGAGLATTAQLEAFRRLLPSRGSRPATDGHGCRSVWMSATLRKHWLETVDFESFLKDATELTFDYEKEVKGLDQKTRQTLEDRWNAPKPLEKAGAAMGDVNKLAAEILEKHENACAAAGKGTRTIIVVNTVKRACGLFEALNVADGGGQKKGRKRVLLHSRFRPNDRKKQVDEALAEMKPGEPGTIVVSTQVIEAGVNVSATTLFTELAPWASLVQRFGRCNRRGEDDGARVFWIDLPGKKADAGKLAPPYDVNDLGKSQKHLAGLPDAGLQSLPEVELGFEPTHVIRRKDLIDLFDTTPDLAGNDIDIDRFVREVEGSDVRVFWRAWDRPDGKEGPPDDEPAPRRDELCAAPIGTKESPGFRKFVEQHGDDIWRWSFLGGNWERADPRRIAPGQVFLIHADAGGYSAERGWNVGHTKTIHPPRLNNWSPSESDSLPEQWASFARAIRERRINPDAYDDDGLSKTDRWQTIAEHTDDVCKELDAILTPVALSTGETDALREAARWHDRGKAHEMFQIKVDDGQELADKGSQGKPRRRKRDGEWKTWAGCRFVAKARGEQRDRDGRVVDQGFWTKITKEDGGRYHFRHELASALAVLQRPDPLAVLSEHALNLVAYLVAAHHGKVRLLIRSLPNELRPRDREGKRLGGRRFARGVWEGDPLTKTDLGGGVTAPEVVLSLEPMELGLCEEEPFRGQPSWAERTIGLRDSLGPFRLAYLEALLRAADCRASRDGEV